MARHKVSREESLRILNETLSRHPAYSAGMAFQNILPDGAHSYEIVMPASVPDRVRAEQVFDAVANDVRLVEAALQDHQQLRELIKTLQEIDNDTAFAVRFHTLRNEVNQHIEDEETTMFPQAAQVLATHWEEITVLLQERKAQILASS